MKSIFKLFKRERIPKEMTDGEIYREWFKGQRNVESLTDDQLFAAKRYSTRFPNADFDYFKAVTDEAEARREANVNQA